MAKKKQMLFLASIAQGSWLFGFANRLAGTSQWRLQNPRSQGPLCYE
jgi:hypothetical protein